jgi:hypothetical protein
VSLSNGNCEKIGLFPQYFVTYNSIYLSHGEIVTQQKTNKQFASSGINDSLITNYSLSVGKFSLFDIFKSFS